jgi:hypothetical protein
MRCGALRAARGCARAPEPRRHLQRQSQRGLSCGSGTALRRGADAAQRGPKRECDVIRPLACAPRRAQRRQRAAARLRWRRAALRSRWGVFIGVAIIRERAKRCGRVL